MKNFNTKQVKVSRLIDKVLSLFLSQFKDNKSFCKQPSSILIFDFHLIGDIVMLTPFLVELRKRHPTAHIGLVAGEWAEVILKNNPNLYDSFYTISAPWVKYDYSFTNLLKVLLLVLKLRKRSWDWGIEVRGDIRQILLLRFTGAKHRIGYSFTGGKLLLTQDVYDDGQLKHIVDHHFQILKSLHSEAIYDSFIPQLWITEDEKKTLDKSLNPKIGLHFGASSPLRKLPEEKALELLLLILEKSNYNIVLFDSPDQENIIKSILPRLNEAHKQRVILKSLKLREFILEIATCKLFIGMDSSGGHIAAALDVPVVSIFGPANAEFCKPIGKNTQVIMLSNSLVSCRPCNQFECVNIEYHFCMKNLKFNEHLNKCNHFT